MSDKKNILRLDASASGDHSSSRKLGNVLADQLEDLYAGSEIRQRDLTQELSFIDGNWIAANFTAIDERDESQAQRLAFSDQLIAELQWADHIVLTTPMYNFGIPATLKAWIEYIVNTIFIRCKYIISF